MKHKLTGRQLRAIGYPEGPVISIAMHAMSKYYKHHSTEQVLAILQQVLDHPEAYLADEALTKVAQELAPAEIPEEKRVLDMRATGVPFHVFGQEFIEPGAMNQMHTAVKLPVAVAGALMPDAHHGYGLPIGGVLATENAVIPYGVGVDIGCRMCLSIFDIDPKELVQRQSFFAREINEATLFGSGATFERPADAPVMERAEFRETGLLRSLHGRAWKQLGSSGSGNHFVEFGEVEITGAGAIPGLPAGVYTGLLSHSGSRALGANIANHFTKLAKEKRHLPGDAVNLAWLNLDEEAGMEYWISMNLAGDYASACHHVIHDKIAKQLGRQPLAMVENHHNFAWKEMHEGRELIVHRKGATPAARDVMGIIPGSMTAPGFIVKGRGEAASINSASHGAGRRLSRTAATNSITMKEMKEVLEKHGVKLLGGGVDESPFAYKNIEAVMQSQKALVDVLGRFTPKIVKMDGTPPRTWRKKPGMAEGE